MKDREFPQSYDKTDTEYESLRVKIFVFLIPISNIFDLIDEWNKTITNRQDLIKVHHSDVLHPFSTVGHRLINVFGLILMSKRYLIMPLCCN